jgi:hypothetical protein
LYCLPFLLTFSTQASVINQGATSDHDKSFLNMSGGSSNEIEDIHFPLPQRLVIAGKQTSSDPMATFGSGRAVHDGPSLAEALDNAAYNLSLGSMAWRKGVQRSSQGIGAGINQGLQYCANAVAFAWCFQTTVNTLSNKVGPRESCPRVNWLQTREQAWCCCHCPCRCSSDTQ